LDGVSQFLNAPTLTRWIGRYPINPNAGNTVGVVMAGNIPLVGYHDYLSVLISGNRLKAKLSTKDSFLITHLHSLLVSIQPAFADLVEWAERLDHIDAVIATGSDNTSRYFEYYFRNIPHIIRKNRTSVAILSGRETLSELEA